MTYAIPAVSQLRRDACESLPYTFLDCSQLSDHTYNSLSLITSRLITIRIFLGKNMYTGELCYHIYSRTSLLFRAHAKYMHVFYQSWRKDAHKNWNVGVILFVRLRKIYPRVTIFLLFVTRDWHNFVNLHGLESFVKTILGNSSKRCFRNIKNKILKRATSNYDLLLFNNEFHEFRSVLV